MMRRSLPPSLLTSGIWCRLFTSSSKAEHLATCSQTRLTHGCNRIVCRSLQHAAPKCSFVFNLVLRHLLRKCFGSVLLPCECGELLPCHSGPDSNGSITYRLVLYRIVRIGGVLHTLIVLNSGIVDRKLLSGVFGGLVVATGALRARRGALQSAPLLTLRRDAGRRARDRAFLSDSTLLCGLGGVVVARSLVLRGR